MKKIEISASILSADMANLTAVTEGLERDGLDMLHFDVMDGQFVPNITFGMPVLAAVDHCTNLFLDVHLMIADPIRYVKQFVDAGADLVTFHIESNSDPAATIAAIHDAGAKAGIVLKPGTPWEEAIPYLAQVEVVLVMTVEPGFGGQSFLWDMVEKVKALILMGVTAPKIEAAVRSCADFDEQALPIYHVSNMQQAVEKAREIAGEGDIVSLSPACASFDLYPDFEVRGRHFKELVNKL